MNSLRLAVTLVTLGALGATGARPAAADPLAVSFDEAIGARLELRELAAATTAATATTTVPVPRPWTPLLVTILPSLRFAPSDQRGVEGGVAIQQAIPLEDLAGARRDHLRARAAQRSAEAAALALDARLEAARTWIDRWAAEAGRDAAGQDVELARAVVAATMRGVAVGVFTLPELADARAFQAEAEVRRADAEGVVAETTFALAEAMGRRGDVRIRGPLPTPSVPAAASWDTLIARARRLPAVVARRLVARAARAQAIDERRTRGRQVVFGLELRRDAPQALAGVATVGFSLPHDGGEREAALAEIDATLADGQADGLAARAAIDLSRALHDVHHTAEILAALEHGLVPAAEEAATRRKRAFELGETTLVELLAAQRVALAARGRVTEARAAHAWARVRAWLLLRSTEVAA